MREQFYEEESPSKQLRKKIPVYDEEVRKALEFIWEVLIEFVQGEWKDTSPDFTQVGPSLITAEMCMEVFSQLSVRQTFAPAGQSAS